MLQPFKWRYILLKDENTSYKYSNVLLERNPIEPLDNTPDGWQEKVVNFGRNSKYFGVFRTFTFPLRFVTEGKKILRHLFYTDGLEKVTNLLIQRQNNAWKYDTFYKGEIDFSKFVDESDTVTVNVMEGGLSKALKANEATACEIPLTGSDLVYVQMDGIDFKSSISYIMIEGAISSLSGHTHSLAFNYGFQEGTSFGVVVGNSVLQGADSFDYVHNNSIWVLWDTEASVTFRIKFDLIVSFTVNTNYRLYLQKNTGFTIDLVANQSFTSGKHTIPVDVTFTLAKDEKVFTLATVTGAAVVGIHYYESAADVSFVTKYAPSAIPALTWYTVFQQLTAKLTNSLYQAVSAYLLTRTDLVMTSGDGVRGLAGAVIKTNLNDFFKALYSILGLGLGIENDEVIIEQLAYFFDNTTEIIDLGEVKDLKVTVAEDLMYNTIKVGYADQKYDNLNGKDEFNTTHIYSTPLTRVVKEWDLTSPYRADSIGHELTRANLIGKKTTDSGSDNDVFVIQVAPFIITGAFTINNNSSGYSITFNNRNELNKYFRSGQKLTLATSLNNGTFTVDYVTTIVSNFFSVFLIEPTVAETVTSGNITLSLLQPKRGPYDSITGVIAPTTIYNVELSPKHNLLRHKNYLASIYDHLDTKQIKFQSTDKNAELQASIGGVNVIEKSDIDISSLGAKLFLPYYFNITCEVPQDFIALMTANSRGYFSFHCNGNKYKGFPWDGGIKPATNDEQEFKLLACPDNVMTNLI